MAKKLSMITSGSNLPVANAGLKLSKIIDIEKIEEHEKFKNLYSIDENLVERIVQNIKENGFDKSQPVHIWISSDDNGISHNYLIDGYTRLQAARLANLVTVPYFEHNFDTFEEAYRYVLHLQIDRRNLSGADFLSNLRELMGSDYVKNFNGNKAEIIAEEMGVSKRTIERGLSVENNASDEQKERIKSGKATVNQIYNENHKKNKNNEEEKTNRHVAVENEDDISDTLSDNTGIPSGLNFSHTDGIERPNNKLSVKEDFEQTNERKNAYELGFIDGFLQSANYVLMQIFNKTDSEKIYTDIFCNEHNYEHFKHCKGNESKISYNYKKFRENLIKKQNIKDNNPLLLETLDNDTEEENDAFDLGFD